MTFDDFIDHLEARPGMYLGDVTFERLESYLLGYQAACNVNGMDDPFDGISELIQCRVGHLHPLGWMGGIRHFLADDDVQAIDLVFSSIHDLQKIQADKGLEWLKSEFKRMKNLKRPRSMNPLWPSQRLQNHKAKRGCGEQSAKPRHSNQLTT